MEEEVNTGHVQVNFTLSDLWPGPTCWSLTRWALPAKRMCGLKGKIFEGSRGLGGDRQRKRKSRL